MDRRLCIGRPQVQPLGRFLRIDYRCHLSGDGDVVVMDHDKYGTSCGCGCNDHDVNDNSAGLDRIVHYRIVRCADDDIVSATINAHHFHSDRRCNSSQFVDSGRINRRRQFPCLCAVTGGHSADSDDGQISDNDLF
jgi:hypothetical protein